MVVLAETLTFDPVLAELIPTFRPMISWLAILIEELGVEVIVVPAAFVTVVVGGVRMVATVGCDNVDELFVIQDVLFMSDFDTPVTLPL